MYLGLQRNNSVVMPGVLQQNLPLDLFSFNQSFSLALNDIGAENRLMHCMMGSRKNFVCRKGNLFSTPTVQYHSAWRFSSQIWVGSASQESIVRKKKISHNGTTNYTMYLVSSRIFQSSISHLSLHLIKYTPCYQGPTKYIYTLNKTYRHHNYIKQKKTPILQYISKMPKQTPKPIIHTKS